jgi:hypothetical protein
MRTVEEIKAKMDACDTLEEKINYEHMLKTALFDAYMNGRLLVLPCMVGDTVYRVEGDEVYDGWQIVFVVVYPDEIVAFDDSENEIHADDIGKTVFLTRAEAEAALKGAEHE